MEMEKEIYHALLDLVHDKISNLDKVNTCEMGIVVDMIKDMSKVLYNMTTVEAMENGGTSVTKIITPAQEMVV